MSKIQICLTVILICIIGLLFLKLKIIGPLGFGQTPMLDLDTYHQIARDVLSGMHPYELSYMQTAGPPLVILPYIPLAFLPLQLGRVIMVWGNLLAGIAACYLLAKQIRPKNYLPICLMLFIFLLTAFTTRFTIEMGQPNLIVMLLVTLLLTSKNSQQQGIELALLTVIKTFFIISSLALIRKHLRVIWFTFLCGVIIFLLSFFVFKPQYYFDYMNQKLVPISLNISRPVNLDYYNQSLKSTFTRFHLESYYVTVFALALLCSVIYLIISGDFKSGIILSILLSPILWQHYLVMIFPIIILLGIQLIKVKETKLLFIYALGILLWWTEFPWLQTANDILLNQILASHYLISLILFLFLSIQHKQKTTFYTY